MQPSISWVRLRGDTRNFMAVGRARWICVLYCPRKGRMELMPMDLMLSHQTVTPDSHTRQSCRTIIPDNFIRQSHQTVTSAVPLTVTRMVTQTVTTIVTQTVPSMITKICYRCYRCTSMLNFGHTFLP